MFRLRLIGAIGSQFGILSCFSRCFSGTREGSRQGLCENYTSSQRMHITALAGLMIVHAIMRIDICRDPALVQGLSFLIVLSRHPKELAPYQVDTPPPDGRKQDQDHCISSQAAIPSSSTNLAKSQSETCNHSSDSWEKGSSHVQASPFLDQLQRAGFNTGTGTKRGLLPLEKCLIRGRHEEHREGHNRDCAHSGDGRVLCAVVRKIAIQVGIDEMRNRGSHSKWRAYPDAVI
jgi:hypothetical protein